MAERPRMTAVDLVDKLMSDEQADVLRDSVAWMAAQLMETDVTARIGVELGERTPDRRQAHRNGYPPRRRAEQALVAVVQEAYVNGISTARSTGWSSSWACAA